MHHLIQSLSKNIYVCFISTQLLTFNPREKSFLQQNKNIIDKTIHNVVIGDQQMLF